MSSFGGIVQPIASVSVQGRTGEDVRLGTPTDGDVNDGLVVLDPLDNVVDTIDNLNEAAKAVDDKDGAAIQVGAPTDGDYLDGQQPIVATSSIADAVDSLNVGLKNANQAIEAFLDRVGWTRVADVTVPGGTATAKTYLDPPNNTVLQTVTVSANTFDVIVEAAYPTVEVNTVPALLPLVGSVYRGAVSVTLGADGPVVVQAFDADGNPGAIDTIDVTIDLPPQVTAAVFTGGKPGGQSELKAGDNVTLDVTADKSFDTVEVVAGAGLATTSQSFPVAPGLNAQVVVTIADQGTTPQALPARVRVLDTVSGAPSSDYDTDAAGTTEDVNVVTLNNLYPTLTLGTPTGFPGGQQALKGGEGASVPVTAATDADTIDWTSPPGHLSITNANEAGGPYDSAKAVTRIGGSYNVDGDGGVANIRGEANRAANDATTVATGIVNIASVAATVTVSEATARVPSGVAPGADTEITVSADQELLNAPTLDPAAGRGTFQGGGFAGGPKTWTRDLRVPDSENPANGSSNTWLNLSATNLAGIATTVITGDDAYVVGGLAPRPLTYSAFQRESNELFPLTTEGNLAAAPPGIFSNGNALVIQPFGTADTTDAGKEGWAAPTAASGLVRLRMLHTPTGTTHGGLTLDELEETP